MPSTEIKTEDNEPNYDTTPNIVDKIIKFGAAMPMWPFYVVIGLWAIGILLYAYTKQEIMVYAPGAWLVGYLAFDWLYDKKTGLPHTWTTLKLVQNTIYLSAFGLTLLAAFASFWHALYFAGFFGMFAGAVWYNNQPKVIADRQQKINAVKTAEALRTTAEADAKLAEQPKPPAPDAPSTIAQKIAEDLMRKQ